MTRWWKPVAVLAAWLAVGVTAHAQPQIPGGYPYPSAVGAARIVEPLRYTPEPQPYLVPGQMTPAMAPAGPPESLNLPASHYGAFQVEPFPCESAAFASIGGTSLKRQGLTRLPIAFTDNQSGGLDTGRVPVGIGTLADGAFNPFLVNSSFLPQALSLHQVEPASMPGGRFTVGYLFGNEAIELTGFFDPNASSSQVVTNRGRLFVPFGPPNRIPIGFEGNNGLFLQADRVRAAFTNEIGNAELNYRTWSSAVNRTELILGLRYFYSRERVDINVDDEFFVTGIFGNRDPKRQASYAVTASNNLVAPQFGGECSAPLPADCLGWIWLTGMFKTAAGPNFVDRKRTLIRGDGLQAFDVRETSIRFSGLSEVSGFVDIHFLERVRFRAGYTALYGYNFSTAGAQVEYDLTNQNRGAKDHGSVFWHGPVAELQFLF